MLSETLLVIVSRFEPLPAQKRKKQRASHPRHMNPDTLLRSFCATLPQALPRPSRGMSRRAHQVVARSFSQPKEPIHLHEGGFPHGQTRSSAVYHSTISIFLRSYPTLMQHASTHLLPMPRSNPSHSGEQNCSANTFRGHILCVNKYALPDGLCDITCCL